MNEKNIINALNSLDDRFLLEASPVSGRGIHLSKKAAALLIAATIAAGASVTAAAVHHFRIGKSVTQLYTGDISESDIDKLSSTTEAWRGSIINETFKDVDFTVDCVTHDLYTDHIWITAARTDGGKFECKDGEVYFIPLEFSHYGNIEGARAYDPVQEGVYYNNSRVIFGTAEQDGTLSIKLDLDAFDEPLENVFAGFGDIIKIRDPYSGGTDSAILEKQRETTPFPQDNDANDIVPLCYADILIRLDKDDTRFDACKEKYENWLNEYRNLYTSQSSEVLSGELLLKTDRVTNSSIVKVSEGERSVMLSATGLEAQLPYEVFEQIEGLEYDSTLNVNDYYTNAHVVFTYKDGTSEVISDGKAAGANGEEIEISVISVVRNTLTGEKSMHISLHFDRPVDSEEVSRISVNGTDIIKL